MPHCMLPVGCGGNCSFALRSVLSLCNDYINLLTVGALRDQLKKAGFKVQSTRRFGFYLPVVAEFGGKAGAGLPLPTAAVQ